MERAKILKDLPWEEMSQQVDNWAETPRVKMVMASIGSALAVVGVPETHHPDAEQLLLFSGAVFFTLFSYWYWFGHRHRRRRKDLEKRLKQVRMKSSAIAVSDSPCPDIISSTFVYIDPPPITAAGSIHCG